MRQKRKEAEIERGRIRSLFVIALSFATANALLLFGFTKVAAAQSVDVAFDLATMLAAPTSTLPNSNEQTMLLALMVAGFLAMTTGAIALMRGLIQDTRQATL